MTKIDFLSLTADSTEARLRLACRVAQKAQRQGQQVFIACQDPAQQAELDSLLWAFEPESFVPHQLLGAGNVAPVEIGGASDCGDHHQLLINMCHPVPDYFSRFERLFELVVQAPEVLAQTRANWSYYKSRGYPLDLKHI